MSFLSYRHGARAALFLTLLSGVLAGQSHAQSDNSGAIPGAEVEPPKLTATPTAADRCSSRDVEAQMEYPAIATRGKVRAGRAIIHGLVTASSGVSLIYVEASDPAFNEPAVTGAGKLICNLTAGTPVNWQLDFELEFDDAALARVSLPQPDHGSAADARRVLILLPQGIDPSNDHDGLNDLSRRLTSALGARLSEGLETRGVPVVSILDQRPVGIQEKLETYAGSFHARHVMVVTVETVPVENEEELRYRVQYSDDDLIVKSGHLEAVVPSGATARTYKIKGSKSGAIHVSVEAIADDFINGLNDDGRLKELIAAH